MIIGEFNNGNSGNDSLQSESDNHDKSERKVRNVGRKPKSNAPTPCILPTIDTTISAREKKKLDQYARLFEQQSLAEQKKLKKIKVNPKSQDQVGESQETKSQKDDRHTEDIQVSEEKLLDPQPKLVKDFSRDVAPQRESQREIQYQESFREVTRDSLRDIQKEAQTPVNIREPSLCLIQEPQLIRQNSQAVIAPIQLMESKPSFPQDDEEMQKSFTIRLNPKLKFKEKHHLFLYLSECQDKCLSIAQKLSSNAPQLYSPPRGSHTYTQEQSSLQAINQEIFHETQILTNNLTSKFKSYGETLVHFGPEQREFVSKYLERKYLKNTLRDSRLQICKRGSEKSNPNPQSFNSKLIPKKY